MQRTHTKFSITSQASLNSQSTAPDMPNVKSIPAPANDVLQKFAESLGISLSYNPQYLPLMTELFSESELPQTHQLEYDINGNAIYVEKATGHYSTDHPKRKQWRKLIADYFLMKKHPLENWSVAEVQPTKPKKENKINKGKSSLKQSLKKSLSKQKSILQKKESVREMKDQESINTTKSIFLISETNQKLDASFEANLPLFDTENEKQEMLKILEEIQRNQKKKLKIFEDRIISEVQFKKQNDILSGKKCIMMIINKNFLFFIVNTMEQLIRMQNQKSKLIPLDIWINQVKSQALYYLLDLSFRIIISFYRMNEEDQFWLARLLLNAPLPPFLQKEYDDFTNLPYFTHLNTGQRYQDFPAYTYIKYLLQLRQKDEQPVKQQENDIFVFRVDLENKQAQLLQTLENPNQEELKILQFDPNTVIVSSDQIRQLAQFTMDFRDINNKPFTVNIKKSIVYLLDILKENKYNSNGDQSIYLSKDLLKAYKVSELDLKKVAIILNSFEDIEKIVHQKSKQSKGMIIKQKQVIDIKYKNEFQLLQKLIAVPQELDHLHLMTLFIALELDFEKDLHCLMFIIEFVSYKIKDKAKKWDFRINYSGQYFWVNTTTKQISSVYPYLEEMKKLLNIYKYCLENDQNKYKKKEKYMEKMEIYFKLDQINLEWPGETYTESLQNALQEETKLLVEDLFNQKPENIELLIQSPQKKENPLKYWSPTYLQKYVRDYLDLTPDEWINNILFIWPYQFQLKQKKIANDGKPQLPRTQMILTNVELFKGATTLTIEDLKDFYQKDQYEEIESNPHLLQKQSQSQMSEDQDDSISQEESDSSNNLGSRNSVTKRSSFRVSLIPIAEANLIKKKRNSIRLNQKLSIKQDELETQKKNKVENQIQDQSEKDKDISKEEQESNDVQKDLQNIKLVQSLKKQKQEEEKKRKQEEEKLMRKQQLQQSTQIKSKIMNQVTPEQIAPQLQTQQIQELQSKAQQKLAQFQNKNMPQLSEIYEGENDDDEKGGEQVPFQFRKGARQLTKRKIQPQDAHQELNQEGRFKLSRRSTIEMRRDSTSTEPRSMQEIPEKVLQENQSKGQFIKQQISVITNSFSSNKLLENIPQFMKC